MAIQLQSRPIYGSDRNWTPEDQTNRREPTLSMRRLRNELRRMERETRLVFDKSEWI